MAFAITGSAMAKEVSFNEGVFLDADYSALGNYARFNEASKGDDVEKIDITNTDTTRVKAPGVGIWGRHGADNETINIIKPNADLNVVAESYGIAFVSNSSINVKNLDVKSKDNAIHIDNGKATIVANNVNLQSQTRGILVMTSNPSDGLAGDLNLTVKESLTINSDEHSLRVGTGNLTIAASNADVTITSKNETAMKTSGTSAEDGKIGITSKNLTVNGVVYADKGTIALEATNLMKLSSNTYDANALKVDSGSVIKLAGASTMQINGDVEATGTLEGLNLVGSDSHLNGKIIAGIDAPVAFSDSAVWNNSGASHVSKLTGTNAVINQKSSESIIAGEFNGDATVTFTNSGKFLMDKGEGTLRLAMDTESDLEKIAEHIGRKDADVDVKATIIRAEGIVEGETVVEVGYDNNTTNVVLDNAGATADYYLGTVAKVVSKENTTNAGIADMAALGLAVWRADNDTLMKRMGELRNANGEQGTWARMTRRESEYGAANMQDNTYSVGYDQKVADDWTVGAAITYKDGSASFAKGSADIEQKGIAFYGTKLNENGSYIDIVAKYTNLDNDYTVNGGIGSGDYDADAYSLSAEYGKRFTQDNGFWVEPQAELTYGHVGSASYTTAAGKAAQDSFDSFVGRVGVLLGKDVAAGNVYAKASYLYDFDGEASMSFSDGKITKTVEDDLGGGWFEVGVGTNINLSKATYVYADVEKTFGGDVDTKWQWNLGVRYSF